MKLAYSIGYWAAGPPADALEGIQAADDLGFDSLWTAEAYGSDCFTPLAWWGSQTRQIRLGTAITQISARTPAATAMAAMTLDHLSGGRFVLGLGASGPQVVEGWYGETYPRPLERTREYVEIVRAILAREAPVTFEGKHYQLPRTGSETTGLGKPLKSILKPRRADLPIMIAAEGPKNVALCAEIADGWLPLFFSPKADAFYKEALYEGFNRPGSRTKPADFEVVAPLSVVIDDDVERAADTVRPNLALYIGGMGAKDTNFHLNVFARMGWEGVCADIQKAYLGGDKKAAVAAVPLEMVDDVALIGPPDRIRDRMLQWKDSVVTTLSFHGSPETLKVMADLREQVL